MYGIGVNDTGGITGEHKAEPSIEFTPCKIEVPCRGKIVKVQANGGRSVAITDKNEIWYWGGITYGKTNERIRVKGFHLLNEEPDIIEIEKKGERIVSYDNGIAHEILLTKSI